MNHIKSYLCLTALLLASAPYGPSGVADSPNATPAPAPPTYAIGSASGGVRIAPDGTMVVSGVAIDQPLEGIFHLRNRRGRIFSVNLGAFAKAWSQLPQTGTLKVFGGWKDGILTATNLKYDDGLYGSRAYSESKEKIVISLGTLTGTLVADADEFGFDLRDAKGVVHSVVTRRFLTERGAKTFRKGDKVRVHGEQSVVDNVPQIDIGFLERLNSRQ